MTQNNRHEYIVIFGKSSHWTSNFLNKSISHVQVVSLKSGFWVRIDPSPQGLDADVTAYDEEIFGMIRKMDDVRVLRVSLHRTKSYFAKFGMMTCTDVVQYAMGLHFKHCWTPYQLYKRLLNERYRADMSVTIIR